jgi:hypothetical protein
MQYNFKRGTKRGTKRFFAHLKNTQVIVFIGVPERTRTSYLRIRNTIYVIFKYPITVIQSKLYKQLQLLTNFEQYPIYVMVLFLNAL